jgi:protein-tyrosine phosphatase
VAATASPAWLRVSGLPTVQQLQQAYSYGVAHLVNVSGVNVYEVYQHSDLPEFVISQTVFTDIFTTKPIQTDFNRVSSDMYMHIANDNERQALLSAVQTLFALVSQQIPVWVFCHRGIGRSPLVVAAALQKCYGESSKQAIARTYEIQPAAHFSEISLSAMQWCQEQW